MNPGTATFALILSNTIFIHARPPREQSALQDCRNLACPLRSNGILRDEIDKDRPVHGEWRVWEKGPVHHRIGRRLVRDGVGKRALPPQVAKLRPPTMLVVGDADSVRTSHAVEFFELLGGESGTAAGTGPGFRGPDFQFSPASRTTTSSHPRRWRPRSNRSSTRMRIS